MNKPITGWLIDVWAEKAEACTLDGSLEDYYRVLSCDTIDITERAVGDPKKRFSIVCDDEGLLKNVVKISAVNFLGKSQLVGSLFVCGCPDANGDLRSLTEKQIEYLRKFTIPQRTQQFQKPYLMLNGLI